MSPAPTPDTAQLRQVGSSEIVERTKEIMDISRRLAAFLDFLPTQYQQEIRAAVTIALAPKI
jgi:hypothetical protein